MEAIGLFTNTDWLGPKFSVITESRLTVEKHNMTLLGFPQQVEKDARSETEPDSEPDSGSEDESADSLQVNGIPEDSGAAVGTSRQ